MNKLKDKAEKNMEHDEELFTFKQEEIPKLKFDLFFLIHFLINYFH